MKLRINSSDIRKIEGHALESFPNECVGLMIGKTQKNVFETIEVVKAKNTLNSPVAFEADPQFVYDVYKDAEKRGLQLIGIYHSHPNLRAYVSARDAEFMRFWGRLVWLILGVGRDEIVERKAFMMKDGKVYEVEVEIVGS
jgi:proteasome lid subunit RPN8/RPN11